jgi:peptide/nickel transport system substrate-binding protein
MTEKKLHSGIPYLQDQLLKGKMSRREFVRYATLLGASVATANALAACGGAATEAPPTAAPEPTQAPATAAPAPTNTPVPTEAPAATGPMRGGTLRIASNIQKVTHPAQFSWVAPSNQLRQVAEYLTLTDGNNITHPYLLESWDASDDLLTWTLNLRQGIKFNNGDDFTADDVIFTMGQWLDEDVGSSMLGLISYVKAENIEKVDDYTVNLYLDRPEIGVPEHLYHYPALILNHRTFEGDFIKAPHGTGPYTLEDYSEGERALLKRRDDYWQTGADGDPLPYLDGMEFIDMGEEMSAWFAAIQAGEIDLLDLGDQSGAEVFTALKDVPDVVLDGIATAQTRVLRMRVDQEPWTDEKVRMALKLCQDRQKILDLAYFSEGALGQDFHVYPGHPEYCEKPIPPYDPEKAKALLAEAGYPDGVDVEIAVASGWQDVVSYAEILKEDAAAAGFNITINTMPISQYWEQWTEVSLGITPWTHRPLGTMVMTLGYTGDEDGNPAAWNETRWVDEEFDELLQEANGTLDVDKRREIFCKLEDIQFERGSIGIAFWKNIWMAYRPNVHDVPAHPTYYMNFNDVWMEEA